ncbi:MAG: hypothetical protein ABSC18_08030 [Verrucomicrobiota bacterium]|jgi:chromosome segregation ATPase
MKSNLPAIILVLACLGLGIFLWTQNQRDAVKAKNLSDTILSQSTRITNLEENLRQEISEKKTLETKMAADERKAASDLDEANKKIASTSASLVDWQSRANTSSDEAATARQNLANEVTARARLETDMAAAQRKAATNLAVANAEIASTTASLRQAQREARANADAIAAASAAIAEKDKKIHELEEQNAELDKQSSDLRSALTNLDARMQAAQKKIDANDGDKNLLMAELKRVQAQKETMENKLSDLAFLKEHVRTLRDNLATDRRADWIRRGLYESISQKGGEHLINPELPGSPATNTPLNVELHQSGGVKVLSPASTNALPARAPSTNALPARPPAARLAPDAGL